MTTIHEAAIKAGIGTQGFRDDILPLGHPSPPDPSAKERIEYGMDVSTWGYGDNYNFTDDNDLNKSGIQPVEYKCLVKLDVVKNTTESGIVISVGDDTEREQMAQVKGVLVAIGHNAFCDWNWKPPLGCRVMISKHEGIVCRGADQDETELGAYRLISDKQLAAVITEE